MDLTTILLTSAFTAVFGLTLGGLALFLARSRIEDYLVGFAEDYIAQKVAEIQENPQILSKALKPVLLAAVKELASGAEGGEPMKDLKIAGFKVPAWLVHVLLQKFVAEPAKQAQNGVIEGAASLIGG